MKAPSKNIEVIFNREIQKKSLKIELLVLIQKICNKQIKQIENIMEELQFLQVIKRQNQATQFKTEDYELSSHFLTDNQYSSEIENLLNAINSNEDIQDYSKVTDNLGFMLDFENTFKQNLNTDHEEELSQV